MMRILGTGLPFLVIGLAVLWVKVFTPGPGGDLNNAILLRAMRERKKQEKLNGLTAFLTRKDKLTRQRTTKQKG